MWIFGKKPNQPIAPPSPDLPPELRPFYGQKRVTSLQMRRLLAATLLVVIVAAAVLLGIWLHASNTSVHKPTTPTKTSTQAAKSNQNKTPAAKPSTTQTKPAQPSQVSSVPTNPSTIPNTGPGMTMFILASAASLLGAALYHYHQIRTARSGRSVSK